MELTYWYVKEIFNLEESIKYFNLEGIGKSPSKLDISRILSINEHYIKNIDEGTVKLTSGGKLKDPRKDALYKYAKQAIKVKPYIDATQYKALNDLINLVDSVKPYVRGMVICFSLIQYFRSSLNRITPILKDKCITPRVANVFYVVLIRDVTFYCKVRANALGQRIYSFFKRFTLVSKG